MTKEATVHKCAICIRQFGINVSFTLPNTLAKHIKLLHPEIEKCTVVDLSTRTMEINPERNSALELENKKQNSFKRSSKSNSMQGFKSDLLIEYKQNLQSNEIAKSEKTTLDVKIEPELCSDQNTRSNQKSSSTKGQLISKCPFCVFQKTNEIFVRISALASKKRSN
jgi:hypothetical protein